MGSEAALVPALVVAPMFKKWQKGLFFAQRLFLESQHHLRHRARNHLGHHPHTLESRKSGVASVRSGQPLELTASEKGLKLSTLVPRRRLQQRLLRG